MNTKQAVDILTEFLDSEIDDYGLNYTYNLEEQEEEYTTFTVTIYQDEDRETNVTFKAKNDNKLFIEICDDSWELVEAHSYSAKYFWIAFLSWPW